MARWPLQPPCWQGRPGACSAGPHDRPDPACPLNDPRYAGAQVLLAGANFGCGSSRETAARAVRGLGFRCVIAVGFGDIFRTNCYRIGVLPVALPATQVAALRRSLL